MSKTTRTKELKLAHKHNVTQDKASVSRVAVRVKPNSQRSQILKFNPERQAFEVALNAQPRDGEANTELIELFHELLKIPKNRIRIVTGLKSRDKVLEIECNAEEIEALSHHLHHGLHVR